MSPDVQKRVEERATLINTCATRCSSNNQNGTFSEIALFADVAATDWSWGAIIADYDLSGDKDIFVTNGIYHDVIDQDFLNGFRKMPKKSWPETALIIPRSSIGCPIYHSAIISLSNLKAP